MLRLAFLQTEKSNRGVGKARVTRNSAPEGSFGDKSSCRQFAHIIKHCGIFVGEFTMNVFGKVSAIYARFRDVLKRCLRFVANFHVARLSEKMMHKYSAVNCGCASCCRISQLRELLVKVGALLFVPAYLSLAFALVVPSVPGDALRFLLLALFFAFLGAGVAFLAAADIVRGR